jgi:methionyl aminopeptidase
MRLLKATKHALKIGIKQVKPGKNFGDIGYAIQKYVEEQGFSVVRDLCGHGIGRSLHEEPEVANYGEIKQGPKIEEGMVFCIEPMVNMGTWQVKKGHDGFSFQTLDGKPSAHFEHMIAVTKHGAKILTKF